MIKQRVGIKTIRELLPQLDSKVFSREIFELMGLFVVRSAIPAETVKLWQGEWDKFYNERLGPGRKVNKFNPVSIDEALPPLLATIHQNSALLDVVEQAFGPDIALFNQRFVIKDENSRGPVFLHQDSPYHIGTLNKASAFVPLSVATPENGGMIFYPGTHQFGYLGDAGEINPELLDPNWPAICPALQPGDMVLMNSLTWHQSGPHISGPDRIMADIIFQPADDPSGNVLVRGQWQTEIFLNRETVGRKPLFVRSRASRLGELQRRVEQLEASAKTTT